MADARSRQTYVSKIGYSSLFLIHNQTLNDPNSTKLASNKMGMVFNGTISGVILRMGGVGLKALLCPDRQN
jgi:tetrahydromethanopterin S-methyltransferase subunit F